MPAARHAAIPVLAVAGRADPAVVHGPPASVTHRQLGTLSAHLSRQVWRFIHSFYKYSVRRYHLPRAVPSTGIQRKLGYKELPFY